VLGNVEMTAVTDPARWLEQMQPEEAFEILSNAAELLAGVLAIAITVVAIVVELAATRYSHRITKLFISEPINIIVMSFFLLTTVQCVWLSATLSQPGSDALLPNAGFAIAMTMVTLSLLLLLPYFYFVFSFISPLSIVQKLRTAAHRIYRRAGTASAARVHAQTLEAIDEIQDIARSAAEQADTRIAMSAIDALADLLLNYVDDKSTLPDRWFEMDEVILHDPDFVSLGVSAKEEVRETRLWFEVKIMRQYLALMSQTVPESRDVANMIAINTQRLGIATAERDPALLELIIRCFNSYMRATIRAGDPRTAYYVMNEYRFLAEALLRMNSFDAVTQIVEYFRYYATFSHNLGESFLLEVAAHDIVRLIEEAVKLDAPIVDDLLGRLLELDQEIRSECSEASLLSVRRAQLQLATVFLEKGDEARARRIVDDMRNEDHERLQRVKAMLMSEQRPQYWEFTDRGVNFSYLKPARRPYLDTLFEWLRKQNP
ncbi:MAG: DUF2254 domain-containing protein, partial [Gammaproteobacteria bacterium]|nr:DUF2254 domain-containing protein [Gammaproteobacteria bacterium]